MVASDVTTEWRCDWCDCEQDDTDGRHDGPRGDRTLCDDCFKRYSESRRTLDVDAATFRTADDGAVGKTSSANVPLQDRIDDALDGSCRDLELMRSLLDEVKREGFKHPSVDPLQKKYETLKENKGSSTSKRPEAKRMASSKRRMSVAASGVGGVIAEAGIAAALSGQVGEQVFDVKMKGKKKLLQLKVGQMNVQLFDGAKVLESFLYVTVSAWEYDASKKLFQLQIQKPGGKKHVCQMVLPGGKTDGKAICELMEKHALSIAKAMKQQKSVDLSLDDVVEEEEEEEEEEYAESDDEDKSTGLMNDSNDSQGARSYSLQDRIDDALDGSCRDLELMRSLLDEVKREGFKHPS
eukprot:SAG31_NODE_2336_length_5921_cov_33.442288_1_plen_351_part_10